MSHVDQSTHWRRLCLFYYFFCSLCGVIIIIQYNKERRMNSVHLPLICRSSASQHITHLGWGWGGARGSVRSGKMKRPHRNQMAESH